jgi:acetyl-CoA carboxylase biotin carboxyl carrier protein
MDLDLAKLSALLDVLNEKDIAELEYEDEKSRVKIVRGKIAQAVTFAPAMAQASFAPPASPLAASAAPAESDDTVDVTSPFVGTFYRSPSPDAPSFVEVGSVVRPGQTLCIIEAMKLMNEIEAECAGTVVECFAQNGKAVEFGQKLFRIKKA